MSMILDDYECKVCGRLTEGWRDEPAPKCCGTKTARVITKVSTPEWGGPRQYRTLREEPFSSRSELAAWAKDNKLELQGDKVGGSRNEDHRRLGKLCSYPGAPTKRSELF